MIAFGILQSMLMLTRAIETLTERCVKGIIANEEHCRYLVDNSLTIVTALNPRIGYDNASRIAKIAQASGRPIAEVILEEGLLSAGELGDLLHPESMIRGEFPSAREIVGPLIQHYAEIRRCKGVFIAI